MPYTIESHNHRLAAWAASTAARASNKCRFEVKTGVAILEAGGFDPGYTIRKLPAPNKLDAAHRKWREAAIASAPQGLRKSFSHGVAAKLINTYLKVRFVCGGNHADPKVAALHPPVDRLLLSSLAKTDFGGEGKQWRRLCLHGWSSYDSGTYEETIDLIRQTLGPGKPLWSIEEYWQGHQ